MVLGKSQKIKVCPYLKSCTGECTYNRGNAQLRKFNKCKYGKTKKFHKCDLLKQSKYYTQLNTMEVKNGSTN